MKEDRIKDLEKRLKSIRDIIDQWERQIPLNVYLSIISIIDRKGVKRNETKL